jgi:CubicO group peptidase (beta-lactamase class C family)
MHRLALVALVMVWSTAANAEPGATWKSLDPSTADYAVPIKSAVDDYFSQYHPTAIMVVQNDLVVATAGDVTRKVNVRSVRKSLLSALIGIAVEHRQINLEDTLEHLAIDDNSPSLTPQEQQATVRQLLMARSGIYHPAAYETRDQKATRPARGAYAPGTFWYYNNWDFNALGAIYEKATGDNAFKGFERLIARPTGMEDFTAIDGRFVGDNSSIYPAYTFNMTARDLARFGLLYLNRGRWNGTQIVPAQWVAESTKAHSDTGRTGLGYGYLWWVLDAQVWRDGATLANGNGGQRIAILPAKGLVIVQVVALDGSSNEIGSRDFLNLARRIVTLVH